MIQFKSGQMTIFSKYLKVTSNIQIMQSPMRMTTARSSLYNCMSIHRRKACLNLIVLNNAVKQYKKFKETGKHLF